LARNFHDCPRARLAAVADADPERLARERRKRSDVLAFASAEELLRCAEVDAVVIASPTATHFPLAQAALASGRPVLVEKPLTAAPEEAAALCALAAEKKLPLLVDHTFLYTPAVRKIRSLIDAGELGDLQYVDSVRINLGLFQRDVNVVWDLAPHDLSIVNYLTGRQPRALRAVGRAHAGAGRADQAHLLLDYGPDLMAHVHVSWLSPVKVRQTIVGGSRRTIIYDDNNPLEKLRVYDRGVELRSSADAVHQALVQYRLGDMIAPHVPAGEALAELAKHFVACVLDGEKPLTPGEDGAAVVRLLAAADRSLAADGERVALTGAP
jgi:predicted dehydrogenase